LTKGCAAVLPDLTTPRLTLRAATDADVDPLWPLLIDPQVRRYLCDDHEMSRAEVAELVADGMARWPAGMGLWLLRDRQNQHVGCVGLQPVSPSILAHAPQLAGEVEPTIALAPDHWGRGYAAEALAVIALHAFATLGLDHLVAVVDEPNEASHRLMARVGFTPTGATPTGPCYPLRTYRLSRPAFNAAGVPRLT
jgi:[ribosomal protein S5]-alanine N-acetyltransferase